MVWGMGFNGRIVSVEIPDANGEPPVTVELRQARLLLGAGDAQQGT